MHALPDYNEARPIPALSLALKISFGFLIKGEVAMLLGGNIATSSLGKVPGQALPAVNSLLINEA